MHPPLHLHHLHPPHPPTQHPLSPPAALRCNRVRVLLVAALLDAALVACLALVQRPGQVWLLYLLLFSQFAATAF